MPMNVPLSQHLHHQQLFVYPIQQCQPISQNWAHIPLTTTTVPCMMCPVTFSQPKNTEAQQASVVSSTLNTPVPSCFKNSNRIWLRNQSPTFFVKFWTKCRLVVRNRKADCHDIVGELLKGCLTIADQLKGNRIRVICYEGGFMVPWWKCRGDEWNPEQFG